MTTNKDGGRDVWMNQDISENCIREQTSNKWNIPHESSVAPVDMVH